MSGAIPAKESAVPHFHLTHLYPDASGLLATESAELLNSKNSAIFVLDTNVLVMPYSTNPKALDTILATYKKLASENRLFIPAQVIREFARIRPEKIKDLFQKLSRHRNSIQPPRIERSTLLDSIPALSSVITLEDEIKQKITAYHAAVGEVLDTVRKWNWNDPVSVGYRTVFTPSVIVEAQKIEADIIEDLRKRFANKIPPGYKDEHKKDEGIGDLIVWQTILEIGQSHKRDIIFVTGEEKSDWWHRSEKESLYPRFELIDEFRRTSGAKFGMARFSDLLEAFGASADVIKEIRTEEQAETLFEKTFGEVWLDIIPSVRFFAAVANWARERWPQAVIDQTGSAIDVLDEATGPIRLIPIIPEKIRRYRSKRPHLFDDASAEKIGLFVHVPEGLSKDQLNEMLSEAAKISTNVIYCAACIIDADGKLIILYRLNISPL